MHQAQALARAHQIALWTFGVASLLAVAIGSVVMARSDVPLGIWIRNPIAWVIAAALSLFLASRGWLGSALPPIALLVIALSLVGPGQEGVYRWLDLGPVQLNAAALVLPAAIVTFHRTSAIIAVACFALIAALLAWQPDISQLAGFVIAALVLVAARFGWIGLVGSVAAGVVAIMVCLSRPDPLDPVAHVEGIFALAAGESLGLVILMAISLTIAALSPLIVWSAHPLGMAAPFALTAYFVATALAPLFGAYPVPLAGYGLSFVVGWWLGAAAMSVQPQNGSKSGP